MRISGVFYFRGNEPDIVLMRVFGGCRESRCPVGLLWGIDQIRGMADLQIIKSINTNAAIGLDRNGREAVLLGKGIGFPKMPYELNDLSAVDRSFYDVEPCYIEMLSSLQPAVLLASADVTEQAEINLDCMLNSNLPFTLGDHLQFAMERISKGINLTAPLAYDVQHLYPKEYELGILALDIFQDYTGVRLPDAEAVNVALHLINAEVETDDSHDNLLTIKIISEIDELVERELMIQLDKNSFHYSRFTMHMRYLIQRLSAGKQSSNTGGMMLRTLAREYPEVYLCARKVADYLNSSYGWKCNDEEKLYILLHIERIRQKED